MTVWEWIYLSELAELGGSNGSTIITAFDIFYLFQIFNTNTKWINNNLHKAKINCEKIPNSIEW